MLTHATILPMDTAEQLLLARGQRATPVRNAVLNVLLEAGNALAHPEILERLQPVGTFDRVTVYRVLEWLVTQGMAHKVAGAGRAWRFQATRSETTHRHAHFQCHRCGKILCLPDVRLPTPKQVPETFSIDTIELNIKGVCADCGQASSN